MYKKLRVILGVVLIILGLLAFFTPLTPGSWLFLIGLELIGFRLIVSKDARHSMWERFKSVRLRRKQENGEGDEQIPKEK
jgi:uncharacterized protein YqgC (DUF456 family)